MAEKMLKTRVINKHETQEDWEKAVNFIPLEGEVIIYDPDNNHKKPRIKIGNGILNPETGIVEGTNVNDLPFITDSNLSDGTKNNSVYQESEKDDTKISLAFTDVRPPEKEDYIGIYNRAEYIGKNATALGTSVAKGDRSLTSGSSNLVEGKGSIALGTDNLVISASSAALGYANFVNGEMSVALGASNVAREKCAVALNGFNNAYGRNSLATGNDTTAMGNYTLTGGLGTYATGGASVALGNSTKAEGECSFTTGYKTQSNEFCQTVVGRHNDLDKSKNALFVVGNGCDTDDKDKPIKRNAFTVNMDGTATLSKDPVYNMDVATKKYVDNSINNIEIPDAGNKSLVFDTKAKLDSWINELPGGKNLLNPWDYDKDKILTQGYVSRDGSIRLDYNTVIDPDAENLTFIHNRYVYNLNLEAGIYTIRIICDSYYSYMVYSKFSINNVEYDLLESTEEEYCYFTKTFELTENSDIELQLENNTTATSIDCWVQLEKGTTPTEYETYIPPYVRENDHLTKNDLNIGDLLLVKEENVPDYYWDGKEIVELEISLPENIVTKEELSNKISLWQPNTEYKVGDMVVVNVYERETDTTVTKICYCIQNHTSSNTDNLIMENDGYAWLGYNFYVLFDYKGRPIFETYATKEELEEALENIPTGEGGTITVDQTYNPKSENAQSGKAIAEAVSDKQDSLVSGTNIKTINNQSILGSGNITIEGEKGEKGDKGDTGLAGYTPVKGTDYWTDTDKTDMLNDVLAALPTWNGGSY